MTHDTPTSTSTSTSPSTPTPASAFPVPLVSAPASWWLARAIPVAIPLTVVLCVILMLTQSADTAGPIIHIAFPDGHGIKTGDTLRYRGITVGSVDTVQLRIAEQDIQIQVTLTPDAAFLAQSDSRFWIVRPRLNLTSISGADTIIGARYIAVSPGAVSPDASAPCLSFTGLDAEPAIIHRDPLGLDIICQAQQRHGLQNGAAISYRHIVIGRVLSVHLASDASAVDVHLYIEPAYRALICENTVFWNASGFNLSGGVFGGVELNVDSLDALLHGGIGIAIPPQAGERAADGQRFPLHRRAEEKWLAWKPHIDLAGLNHGLNEKRNEEQRTLPSIIEVHVEWSEKGFFSDTHHDQQAQVIAVNGGLIGPSSALNHHPLRHFLPHLRIDDLVTELPDVTWESDGLCFLPLPLARIPWTQNQMRVPTQIEEADIIINPLQRQHIAVARLHMTATHWTLDSTVDTDDDATGSSINRAWHGCPVLARSDGKLIGFLLIDADEQQAHIAPLSLALMQHMRTH